MESKGIGPLILNLSTRCLPTAGTETRYRVRHLYVKPKNDTAYSICRNQSQYRKWPQIAPTAAPLYIAITVT